MSIGTSGGMWGPERGYCMMMGDKDVIDYFDPIFNALAPGKAISDDHPGARIGILASSAATSIAARAAPVALSR
jgi:6-phosphogluconate dehydrogenase (decarboxylating)